MLKSHVGLGLETQAAAHDVDESGALLGKGVDNGCAGRSQGSLEHVGEDRENAVEALKVLGGGAVGGDSLPPDTGEELGDEDQVDDQGGSEKGVLAHVEERNSLVTAEEDLSIVLIKSTLVVADSGHVLDDNGVVGLLAGGVENGVGLHHVVNDVGLGDLLGAELSLLAQVLAVVVAEMVVAGNGGKLDTGVDEEVDEGRLHLGLARLEVITTDEGPVALGKLNGTGNEGVLGGAVDEGGVFEDASNSEDGGGRDLLVAVLNGLEEVVGSVVDTLNEVSETLSVGGPLDDDTVKVVGSLEVTVQFMLVKMLLRAASKMCNVPNVLADLLNVGHGGLGALEDVVGTLLLVGSNEVGVVDARKGDHGGHLLGNQSLEAGLENLGAVHSLGEVELADVPAADDNVVGVDHGEEVVEGDVDILAGLGIGAELDGRAHDQRAVVVGLLLTAAGLPGEPAAVGNDAGGDGGTVVAAPANEHHTQLGDLGVDIEVVLGLLGDRNILAVNLGHLGGVISVLGADLVVGVLDVGGVDLEGHLLVGGGGNAARVDRSITVRDLSVGSHC